jgi:hypothetical protein
VIFFHLFLFIPEEDFSLWCVYYLSSTDKAKLVESILSRFNFQGRKEVDTTWAIEYELLHSIKSTLKSRAPSDNINKSIFTIRSYLEKDKDSGNMTAFEAFTHFKGCYKDWEYIKSPEGGMASLKKHSNLIAAEINNEAAGAAALVHSGKDSNKNINSL